jgi:hypothetical protein
VECQHSLINGLELSLGVVCTNGYIAGVISRHENITEDRQYQVKCCGYASNLRSCTGTYSTFCEPNGWIPFTSHLPGTEVVSTANLHDISLGVDCGAGYMVGLRRAHNSNTEDEIYEYKCFYPPGYSPGTFSECTTGGYDVPCNAGGWGGTPSTAASCRFSGVNPKDVSIGINCGEGYLVGVSSYHDNVSEDRSYQYKCCYPPGVNAGTFSQCIGGQFTWCTPGGFNGIPATPPKYF